MRIHFPLCALAALILILALTPAGWGGPQRDAICRGECGGGCPCSGREEKDVPTHAERAYSAHVEAYNTGNRLWGKGNYPEAERYFHHALELEPGDPATLHALGAAIGAQGRFSEAETFLRRAIQARPKKGGWHASLSWVLHNLNRLKDADDAAREAVRLNASDEYAHRSLRNIRNDRITAATDRANQLRSERHSRTFGRLLAIANNATSPGGGAKLDDLRKYYSACFDTSEGSCAASTRLLSGSPTVLDVIKALQTDPVVPPQARLRKPTIAAFEASRHASRERAEAARKREAEAKGAANPDPGLVGRHGSEAAHHETNVAGANAAIIGVEFRWEKKGEGE